MTTTISTLVADMPTSIKGFTLPDANGDYTIFINSRYSYEVQYDTYVHEINHIQNNDFDKHNVEEIEKEAHDLNVDNPDPRLKRLEPYIAELRKEGIL